MSAKHTGSALTGAAVLFVLLRLLAVSHYQWHTAFALLHTLELDDAPGLFLGTFMADDRISTVVLMVVTPATSFYFFQIRKDPERPRSAALLAFIVLVALTVSHTLTYHRWWVPVGEVVAGVVMFVAIRNARWLLRWFAVMSTATVLAVAAVVSTPWVPKERINDTEDVRKREELADH